MKLIGHFINGREVVVVPKEQQMYLIQQPRSSKKSFNGFGI